MVESRNEGLIAHLPFEGDGVEVGHRLIATKQLIRHVKADIRDLNLYSPRMFDPTQPLDDQLPAEDSRSDGSPRRSPRRSPGSDAPSGGRSRGMHPTGGQRLAMMDEEQA